MKAVEFSNVTLKYDENVVLDNISFVIEKGEFVSIIGYNGAGKSSIGKIIAGLLKPTEGLVKVFDSESKKNQRVGMVFQNPDNQFVGNTVADDIAFGLENRQIKQQDMDPIIDKNLIKMGMLAYKHYEPGLLSGGQKQRVAIAGNLALNLDLLIFDEATSMIDPKGQREVNDTIINLKEENPDFTIIQITHNMEEVLNSNRVLVINDGKIDFDGKPDELFSNDEIVSKNHLDRPFLFEIISKLKKIGFNVNYSMSEKEVLEVLLCQ